MPFSSEHPYRRFSLAEIQLATNNFDPETIIGKGGFGKVYKGFIDDGGTRTTVTIKWLDCLSRQRASKFWTKVKMLSRVRHGHLTLRLSNLVTCVIFVLILLDIVVYKLRKLHEKSLVNDEKHKQKSMPFSSKHPCHRFSLAKIQLATNNFDPETIIGKGGFGKVYKGFIDDGRTRTTVAIKRLDCLSRQRASKFWTEVKMLSRVRHGHSVSLIGYCNVFNEMLVVYEYISDGDHAKRLHKVDEKSIRTPLSWEERLKICIRATHALDYLYTGTGVKNGIIHRDVKSQNMFLDGNMAAKLSDLGLSKIGPVDQSLIRKFDVYSFGIVLLEILCGRPAVDPSLGDDELGLVGWAQRNIKEGTLNDIIDLNMMGQTPCSKKKIQIMPDCLKAFVKIAVKCLPTKPKDRPTMSEVVVDLEAALTLQERGEYLVRSLYNNDERICSSSYRKSREIMTLSRMLRKILPAKTQPDGLWLGKKKSNKDGYLKKLYRAKVELVSKKLKILV
nr:putative serine/threonine/dual specificity protein kinase, catalytic domain-containing protein [Tanacetum cinerariifolium]